MTEIIVVQPTTAIFASMTRYANDPARASHAIGTVNGLLAHGAGNGAFSSAVLNSAH